MGGDEGPELKDHSLVGEEKEQLKTELHLALSPTITKPFKARRINLIQVQSLTFCQRKARPPILFKAEWMQI